MIHTTRTSKHDKSIARMRRQNSRRKGQRWMSVISENGLNRSRNRNNANKKRKSKNFKGAFFEKFVSDLKKAF